VSSARTTPQRLPTALCEPRVKIFLLRATGVDGTVYSQILCAADDGIAIVHTLY